MKSKLFPQCKQRIHPVLNIYYYSLTGWYWTPGDIHDPTRKVAALGVQGGEGGEPKNNQRIKRPKQNWAVRRPIVTKRSTANAKHRKSIPPAMSQRNQHLTHAMLRKPATTTPKQFQTTWCFGKDWRHAGGARDLQSATVFPRNPAIPLRLQKHCFLVKLRHFSQKRSLQQSHFWGRKHIGFLDSKKWSSPVALKACSLNKTQLWFTCVM